MFKFILYLGLLFSFNVNAETNKSKMQALILQANALTIFASTPGTNKIKNITPQLISSGAVNVQFNPSPSTEYQQAIQELIIDRTNNLIINKEGEIFNVYRYNDDIKVLVFN